MRRGIDETGAIGKEEGTSRPPLSRADEPHIAAIEIHGEDLIAPKGGPGGLENELGAVEGKICLRVLPTEGELHEVGQVLLARLFERLVELILAASQQSPNGEHS
jgi:hypothetical protein